MKEHITIPDISEEDIPSGHRGINRECYTYGELRRHPIIPEVMRNITNFKIRKWAEECNFRNHDGFIMRMFNGEYSFDGLQVGPKVQLPSLQELRESLGSNFNSYNIRTISYRILREELAKQTGLTIRESSLLIGNMLDCAPHEDISGFVCMIPNWAHRWFSHKGYVHRILRDNKRIV